MAATKRAWFLLLLVLLCLGMSACQNKALEEKEAMYVQAQDFFNKGNFEKAEEIFLQLGTYRDSKYVLSELKIAQEYERAIDLLESKNYPDAYAALCALGDYKDVPELLDRFHSVNLTTENWDTYYEIVEVFEADPAFKTEQGYYKYMNLDYIFRLKEGFQEAFYAPEQNSISISIQATTFSQDFFFNEETGDYYYTDSDINVFTSRRVHNAELEGDKQEITLIAGRIFSETNGVSHAYYSCSPWKDFTAVTVTGRLYLYEE